MTVGLFVVVVAVIGALWFIKLSDVLKKASEADKNEKKKGKIEMEKELKNNLDNLNSLIINSFKEGKLLSLISPAGGGKTEKALQLGHDAQYQSYNVCFCTMEYSIGKIKNYIKSLNPTISDKSDVAGLYDVIGFSQNTTIDDLIKKIETIEDKGEITYQFIIIDNFDFIKSEETNITIRNNKIAETLKDFIIQRRNKNKPISILTVGQVSKNYLETQNWNCSVYDTIFSIGQSVTILKYK